MEKARIATIMMIALAAFDVLIYLLFYSDPNFSIFSMAITSVFSIAAASSAYYAFTCHGLDSFQGKSLFYMFMGLSLWSLAEISWTFDTLLLGVSPNISSIDIIYYLGYAFLLFGFYILWKITRSKNTSLKGWLFFIFALLIMMALSLDSLKNTFDDQERIFSEKIVNIGYPIMDFLLASSLLSLVVVMQRTRQTNSWVLVLAGFFVTAVADLIYAITAGGDYFPGMMDIMWQFSYILIALGFIFYYKSMKFAGIPYVIKKKSR